MVLTKEIRASTKSLPLKEIKSKTTKNDEVLAVW
jgi:hypothetical protein